MGIKILIFGGRGSGKTTVTDMLIERLGDAKEVRLADYVKNACEAFGVEPTRENLVWIGTDIGREQVSKRVWIDKGIEDVNKGEFLHYIISDVRFDNEYEIFKDEGFFPVLIDVDLEKRIDRVIKRDGFINYELLEHESEQNWKHFEPAYVLDNNGTMKELEEKIDLLISIVNYWRG